MQSQEVQLQMILDLTKILIVRGRVHLKKRKEKLTAEDNIFNLDSQFGVMINTTPEIYQFNPEIDYIGKLTYKYDTLEELIDNWEID